jgi:phosphoribosylamine--glycine ligase
MLSPTVLVVGSGAREHAIASALRRFCGGHPPALLCFGSSRNPGIQALCGAYEVGRLDDADGIAAFGKAHGATLAVIGPEAPLDAGAADALRAAGIPVVGPSKALSQIEGSKAFALRLLRAHGMAGLPDFREFSSVEGAREYLEELGAGNYVVKADGLCGGKGVKVAGAHLASIDEAVAYCAECLPRFVICEKLVGQEFSLLSLTDGTHLAHMPPLQDHKRAYDGDEGPNTGGMGAYSCADHLLPFLSEAALGEAKRMQAETVLALKAELGESYRGVLYGGYMLTAKGTFLIEYNARFGDPECLNLLSLLDPAADFLAACEAVAQGHGLASVPLPFRKLASCCKYAVPEGYPNQPKKVSGTGVGGLWQLFARAHTHACPAAWGEEAAPFPLARSTSPSRAMGAQPPPLQHTRAPQHHGWVRALWAFCLSVDCWRSSCQARVNAATPSQGNDSQ